jgi:hypothetical protein
MFAQMYKTLKMMEQQQSGATATSR